MTVIVKKCATPAQTEQLAQALAVSLRRVDLPLWICLDGELGSGKTAFVRYLLQALGVDSKIKSPTYTLLESYDTSVGTAHHFDLYRLQHPAEWDESGFAETALAAALFMVEWRAQALGQLPAFDLQIDCAYEDEGRSYAFTALSDKAKGLLQWLSP
ncbi:MAG: hypothetical protein RLZZ502_179 [Pseudomonadota bacterium]|jgi:tRNA threonylcarbamoyladenosine biosynthesis protein TsaE